ncbi:winged helix-turn-helix DNA-binding protein [Leptospira interrogans serovar Valbuzzi str. Duyster]|uniref:DNA-binding protein n=1 Tax=Leptospira interrogans TaxID=173 RepID=UPI0002BE711E|nr:DNA-binding protein [Leptospira interrogans]EMJ58839.1 winged helix-turn-helix DNA-binding protein [Leptospira interrogans serovar Valbuzzi str. Duyster]ENO74199.1 winged helix-turn-helix DNA-binding protein [Leptospira interrogans serovar Valbuzzi str. Valbuzzi]
MTEVVHYALVVAHAIESLPLSRAKRQLLSKITDLDIAGRINGFGGCIAKNKTLGEEVGLAETTVSKYIREMRREGYINSGEFHGHYRILNSSLHDTVVQERYEYNLQKQITKYTSQSSTNILESTNQSTGSAPYKRTGDCINNQSTNQTNNKKKVQTSSLSKITWENILEHSKNLILKEWGEYDHNPEKESAKIKSWKKLVPENPEAILETLRKLIHIRRSEEYKADRFWGTIPVNIASSYSYKDIIKNTYNLLTQAGNKAPLVTENKKEVKTESKVIDPFKNEPTWEGFLVWAKERLSKTSYENLKELRIKFENEGLYIVGDVSDSLKMIVSKYFNEEAKLKTEIKFVKEEELQENEQNFNSNKKLDPSNQENQTQPNQESSISVDQSENQDIKTFRDYISVDKVIHEFINHSSLKLNRPDLEEIRKLRISYDLEKIVIYDPLPERLKNHIRDYFYSHPQRIIALQFEEGKNKFHVAA